MASDLIETEISVMIRVISDLAVDLQASKEATKALKNQLSLFSTAKLNLQTKLDNVLQRKMNLEDNFAKLHKEIGLSKELLELSITEAQRIGQCAPVINSLHKLVEDLEKVKNKNQRLLDETNFKLMETSQKEATVEEELNKQRRTKNEENEKYLETLKANNKSLLSNWQDFIREIETLEDAADKMNMTATQVIKGLNEEIKNK